MRGIKFRVWDKEHKEWIQPQDALLLCIIGNIITERGCIVDTSRFSDSWIEYYDNIELIQFTGLLDKNGKEGWDGDVFSNLSEEAYHDEKPMIMKIVWEGGCWWGESIKVVPHKQPIKLILAGLLEMSEIIGNVYENPELLEQEEKKHGRTG